MPSVCLKEHSQGCPCWLAQHPHRTPSGAKPAREIGTGSLLWDTTLRVHTAQDMKQHVRQTAFRMLLKGTVTSVPEVYSLDFQPFSSLFKNCLLQFASGACFRGLLTVPTLGSAMSTTALQHSKLSPWNHEKCFLAAPLYLALGTVIAFCLNYLSLKN